MPKTEKRKVFNKTVPHWLMGATYTCVILAIILVGVKFALHGWVYKSLFMENTYQAVTLMNGQTLFGQLQQYGPGVYVLEDVYYLQSTSAEVPTDTEATIEGDTETSMNSSGLQLIKLVDDVHKPLNHVVINKDQVVYWQNLSPASPIIEGIVRNKQATN